MSDTAASLVDMMNSYQHPDAENLIPSVEKIIDPLRSATAPSTPRRLDTC
jgi:hypothetical protein